MDIIVKMQEFNTLIDRKNKGEIFLNDPEIPNEEKIKHIDTYLKLQNNIVELQAVINDLGYQITATDLWFGIGRVKEERCC